MAINVEVKVLFYTVGYIALHIDSVSADCNLLNVGLSCVLPLGLKLNLDAILNISNVICRSDDFSKCLLKESCDVYKGYIDLLCGAKNSVSKCNVTDVDVSCAISMVLKSPDEMCRSDGFSTCLKDESCDGFLNIFCVVTKGLGNGGSQSPSCRSSGSSITKYSPIVYATSLLLWTAIYFI